MIKTASEKFLALPIQISRNGFTPVKRKIASNSLDISNCSHSSNISKNPYSQLYESSAKLRSSSRMYNFGNSLIVDTTKEKRNDDYFSHYNCKPEGEVMRQSSLCRLSFADRREYYLQKKVENLQNLESSVISKEMEKCTFEPKTNNLYSRLVKSQKSPSNSLSGNSYLQISQYLKNNRKLL